MSYSYILSLPAALRDILLSYFDGHGIACEVMTGPRSVKAGADVIMVQTPRSALTDPRTGGYRDEDGTLELRAHVERTGAGEDVIDDARERADQLFGYCDAAIAADVTLGGLVRWAVITAVSEEDQGVEDRPAMHSYLATATVTFKALPKGA